MFFIRIGFWIATALSIKKAFKKIKTMELAISRTPKELDEIISQLHTMKMNLFKLEETLRGNNSKNEIGEKSNPTILSRLSKAINGASYSTYGPTQTQIKNIDIAKRQFVEFEQILKNIIEIEMPAIEKALFEAGAPVVE